MVIGEQPIKTVLYRGFEIGIFIENPLSSTMA
jgi:hypothetical protein